MSFTEDFFFHQGKEMQHTKPITWAAVVTALMSTGTAMAATDDMGMQYTSASEGLTGSFRINLYNASDDGTNDTVKGAERDSLRLYFNGTADLGNGLSSTYGLELRAGGGTCGDDQCTKTQAYHLGLNGVFGSLQLGRFAGAGFMVPGGSLDSVKGNSRGTPMSDPGDQTFKFTSPSINGLQFGFSAMLNDEGDHAGPYNGSANTVSVSDDLLDEVSFAAVYDTPLGLKIGAAYDKAAQTNKDAYQDDITGYRFGAHYGQDNWKVAYEFRTYDNFSGGISSANSGTGGTVLKHWNDANDNDAEDAGEVNSTMHFGDGASINDYQVHAFAVQFNLDKVTASANYSAENVSFDAMDSDGTGAGAASTPKDLGKTKLGVDIKYALGSKSSILLGFATTETETHATNNYTALGTSTDADETTLRYQVDF